MGKQNRVNQIWRKRKPIQGNTKIGGNKNRVNKNRVNKNRREQ